MLVNSQEGVLRLLTSTSPGDAIQQDVEVPADTTEASSRNWLSQCWQPSGGQGTGPLPTKQGWVFMRALEGFRGSEAKTQTLGGPIL